jgi:vacuolar-type H+-ATPase subunit H
MITRTTGCAGQQQARSSRQTDELGSRSSWGSTPVPGAPLSAPAYGNLGFMIQASAGGVPACRDRVPRPSGQKAPGGSAASRCRSPEARCNRRIDQQGLGAGRERPSALSSGPSRCLPMSMPPLRDFLTRFRPAGSPGAAAGVPADRSGELESEVAPVLTLLDDTETERECLIAQARPDAEQIVAAARSEAAAIAADAAQRAETVREQAAQRAMTAAREQALAEVTLALEEQELADAARLRLAVSPGRRPEAR